MKRKIFAVLLVVLALLMMFGLTACRNPNSQDTDTNNDSSTDGPGNQDNTTPIGTNTLKPVIKYLRISELGTNKVTVRFNAIGNNLKYDIRYSTKEINADNFDAATEANAIVTGTGEVKIAVINGITANASSKYYIGIRAAAGSGDSTIYSETLTIRAGGIEIIKLDGTKMDAIYSGEVIKGFEELIDEQEVSNPHYGTSVSMPSSVVPKFYYAAGETTPGSFVPHETTHPKYGMTLRPIIDLETEHYVEAVYVYYGVESYPLTVNTSLKAANYDTLEAWDGVHYSNEAPNTKGWTKIPVQKETRYVQIGFVDGKAPTEVLVYGYATGDGDDIGTTQRKLPTINDFMGACGFTASGGGNCTPEQLACFGVLREYVNLGWVYSWSQFPGKPTTVAKSSMADFDKNYGSTYKDLIVIPCLQWNEGSNPARYYDRLKGKLSAEIASEESKFLPETYAAYADVAYQYAARYGSCRMGYLLDAVSAHSMGTPKAGLNYLQWIELGNEPNGEDQNGATPYQLAALTSAAYDGHQRTILTDVFNPDDFTYFFGAKNADPDFKVAMAGLAGIGSNYISSMVYWMKANRTDGCIAMDAFNVHTYFGKSFELNGQIITVGVSPEEYGLIDEMSRLVEFRDKYYPNVEVWITEFGWDTNQSYETPTSAHAYAEYSGREVQAMWLARAYLLLSASGVDKATMYMCEDAGTTDDRFAYGKYGTCGIFAPKFKDTYENGKLVNVEVVKDEWGNAINEAKESYYILYTLKNALGNMSFQRELVSGNDDVWIYEYADDEGNYGYALWCPTSNGTKVDGYKLYVGDNENATLISNNFEEHRAVREEWGEIIEGHTYTTEGDRTNLVAENGYVSVNVSENPVYVIVGNVND